MKKFAVVMLLAVLVGIVPSQPVRADNIFAEIGKVLFGSDGRAVAVERVDATSAIFMQPRDGNWGVSYFAVEGECGTEIDSVYDYRVPLQRSTSPVLTGLVQVTQGSGELREVTARIDSGQQFAIVDPPDPVENQESWYRDVAYELRSGYREDSGYRLPPEVFPPFVSVDRGKGKRPDGPYYFALPTSNLSTGAHRVSFRFVSKDRNGEFVTESHVDFMILADDITSAPTVAGCEPEATWETTSTQASFNPAYLTKVMQEVGYAGNPMETCQYRQTTNVEPGLVPVTVVLPNASSRVVANGKPAATYHGFTVLWCDPGMSISIEVDGRTYWQGRAPQLGSGRWISK